MEFLGKEIIVDRLALLWS